MEMRRALKLSGVGKRVHHQICGVRLSCARQSLHRLTAVIRRKRRASAVAHYASTLSSPSCAASRAASTYLASATFAMCLGKRYEHTRSSEMGDKSLEIFTFPPAAFRYQRFLIRSIRRHASLIRIGAAQALINRHRAIIFNCGRGNILSIHCMAALIIRKHALLLQLLRHATSALMSLREISR